MVTPVGAKLIDFGISAVQGEADIEPDGGIRGTPVYVAPERLHGHAVAPPADVFALGIVLYLTLSGRLPWRAGERGHTGPRPLPLTDGLPSEVAELCGQCLALDPGRRPDAAAVAAVLTEAAGPHGVHELVQLAAGRDGIIEVTQLMARLSTTDVKRGHRAVTAKVGAVASLIAVVLTLVWSTAQRGPVGDGVVPQAVPAQVPQPACDVTFRLAADDGRRFAADIVATPLTQSFRHGWRLSVPVPAEGLDVDGQSGWVQHGSVLMSPPQPSLGVGQPIQVALSGSHSGAFALPTTVSVDGHDCEVGLFASLPVPAAEPAPAAGPGSTGSDRSRPTPPGHANGADRGNGPGHHDGNEDED
jgi:serine/threonine-protein kinase